MAINFPNSPVNGDTYTFNAVTYVYSKSGTDEGYWRVALPSVSGVATVAEIDAGVNAVKYISPLGLENSKYNLPQDKTPILLVISGQSNAAGSNLGGPNPANENIYTWNGSTNAWGGSSYLMAPWTLSSPHGNSGNSNIGLATAHRLHTETGRPVYIVFDAVGGTSIEKWVETGITSERYVALTDKITAALATPELTGITKADLVIWQQGEEDALTHSFQNYLDSYTTLMEQFRAESWCEDTTPILCGGASELHDRYEPNRAARHYNNKFDTFCVWVNSGGLETEGDATHFSGTSLWEMGYYRMYQAYVQAPQLTDNEQSLFYGRGVGVANPADPTVVTSFSSLVSWDSKTNEFPVNAAAATGSVSWGFECSADGNYTYAFGYQTSTDNLANYTLVAGRDVTATSTGDYGGGFGYQNVLTAPYGFVSGRGNTIADDGGAAVGTFSKYNTEHIDEVMFQVGIGTSNSNRDNAITCRKSGEVEIKVPTNTAMPRINNGLQFSLDSDTVLRVYVKGSDGTVRSATLNLT